MTTQRINEKLGAWLLEDGHTRDMLAQELGMTRPTLANRINGITSWEWEEVVKLSRVVGCTVNDFVEVNS